MPPCTLSSPEARPALLLICCSEAAQAVVSAQHCLKNRAWTAKIWQLRLL